MPSRRLLFALLLPSCLALSACDLLGEEAKAQAAAAKDAEGRAVGAGCRHTGRSLEDCYMLNPKALKAAVFTGWRDMDGYMRENKIDIVPPTMAPSQPAQDAHGEASAEKPAQAANAPPSAKPGETPSAADKGKPATPAKADKH